MWGWAQRIGEHRNKLFHGEGTYQPRADGSDIVAAHEIVWLARPLLYRLNRALQERLASTTGGPTTDCTPAEG